MYDPIRLGGPRRPWRIVNLSPEMSARELMQAADHLTGVHFRMTAEEIRTAQDISRDMLIIRYAIEKYKEITDSDIRYQLAELIRGATTRSPHLKTIVFKELPRLILRDPKPRTGKRR
jgi:hypothetical protein